MRERKKKRGLGTNYRIEGDRLQTTARLPSAAGEACCTRASQGCAGREEREEREKKRVSVRLCVQRFSRETMRQSPPKKKSPLYNLSPSAAHRRSTARATARQGERARRVGPSKGEGGEDLVSPLHRMEFRPPLSPPSPSSLPLSLARGAPRPHTQHATAHATTLCSGERQIRNTGAGGTAMRRPAGPPRARRSFHAPPAQSPSLITRRRPVAGRPGGGRQHYAHWGSSRGRRRGRGRGEGGKGSWQAQPCGPEAGEIMTSKFTVGHKDPMKRQWLFNYDIIVSRSHPPSARLPRATRRRRAAVRRRRHKCKAQRPRRALAEGRRGWWRAPGAAKGGTGAHWPHGVLASFSAAFCPLSPSPFPPSPRPLRPSSPNGKRVRRRSRSAHGARPRSSRDGAAVRRTPATTPLTSLTSCPFLPLRLRCSHGSPHQEGRRCRQVRHALRCFSA